MGSELFCGGRSRALWSVPGSRFLVGGDVNRGMFEVVRGPDIETGSNLTADRDSSMAFELKFDNGAATEATTWVTRAPAAGKVPFLGETLFEASKRGMCIGLHVESGSIIVHFAELVTGQNAMCKMRTVLGKGMLMNPPLGDFEAMDSYHAEFWELIPPQLPPMMDLILKYDSSGNDFAVGASATTETDALHASHGELFTQFLEEFLRQQRAVIKKISWVTDVPAFVTIYGKPYVIVRRKLEWINWKASKFSLRLTLPVFMAFFKQGSRYQSNKGTLEKFKLAVEEWSGSVLHWKGLREEDRNLIKNICKGRVGTTCRNCSLELDPRKKDDEYCSKTCKSAKMPDDDEPDDDTLPLGEPDHLYVMRYIFDGEVKDTLVKIGRSKCPEKRRRSLEQCQCFRVHLSACFHGCGDHEHLVHSHLTSKGLQIQDVPGTEWFHMSLAEAVQEIGIVLKDVCDVELEPPLKKPRIF